MIRRPYLSSRVVAGLQSIAARNSATDPDEATALLWISRLAAWRLLPSEPTRRMRASVSPAGEGLDPSPAETDDDEGGSSEHR